MRKPPEHLLRRLCRFAVGRPGTSTLMTDRPEGAWRDEEKLPVEQLSQAMASWDTDGQGDESGNDAGAASAAVPQRDPSADDPDRPLRPSTTGHPGPN
jgi:hypothetical protein